MTVAGLNRLSEWWYGWRNRRFDRRLANVMSWRLIHELKARGDLLMGEDADIGQTKGKAPNMRPVDRYGLPLWRIKVED